MGNIGETRIWESKNEKLLGLSIDRNLNYNDHVCKKACKKLSTLFIISNYMRFEKKENLKALRAIVESRFGYCPLTWIHSRKANSKINYIHEKTLRIIYKGNISFF